MNRETILATHHIFFFNKVFSFSFFQFLTLSIDSAIRMFISLLDIYYLSKPFIIPIGEFINWALLLFVKTGIIGFSTLLQVVSFNVDKLYALITLSLWGHSKNFKQVFKSFIHTLLLNFISFSSVIGKTVTITQAEHFYQLALHYGSLSRKLSINSLEIYL